jgi:putative heme-binding domain-containing protein
MVDAKDLANALGSSTEGIRENALQVADRLIEKPGFANNADLQKQLIGLADDQSARVRFQWLCSSSYVRLPNSDQLRAKILAKDIEDPWAGIAAIAASQDTEEALLKSSIQTLGTSPSAGKSTFFSYLAATLVKKGDPAFLSLAIDQNPSNDWWQAAIWYGVATLIKEAGVPFPLEEKQKEALLASFLQTNQPELRSALLSLFKSLGLPKNSAQFALVEQRFNQSKDAQFQRVALSLLALRGDAKTQATLIQYLSSKSPVHLQLGAIESLPNTIAKADLQKINTYYPSLSRPVKKAWIAYLLEHENQVTTLLQEVKKNNIKRADLEWPQIVGLMNYYDTGIRGLARSVLAIAEDRKAILQNYLPAAEKVGDVAMGQKVFEANCTSCHAIKNLKGVDFGPNLNTLKSRNALSIITEIINPNNSIADKYGQWDIELKNGTRLTGIITSENDQTIALKLIGGTVQNISKSNIKAKKDLRVSAMPNGLEANISVQAMADLLAYIKK